MIGFSKNGNNDIRETIGAALSNFHTMLRAKDIQQVVNKNQTQLGWWVGGNRSLCSKFVSPQVARKIKKTVSRKMKFERVSYFKRHFQKENQ